MQWIEIEKGNCSDCYKCLRSCPSKAIKIIDGRAEVVKEMCIVCGHCQVVCPQHIIKVKSRLRNVQAAIDDDFQVIASIAPSFVGAFDMKYPGQFKTALKKLGFSDVSETGIGAEYVKQEYIDALKTQKYKNFITSSCPSANYLIQKYYPKCIDFLAPTVSPMLAHGKLMKKNSPNAFTVFIGPCIAKKQEAFEYKTNEVINEVLTFDEIAMWLKESNIKLNDLQEEEFENPTDINGASFPVKGGIFSNLKSISDIYGYQYMQADGVEACINILEALSNHELEGVCVELNMCEGSCIGGPAMPSDHPNCYVIEKRVRDFAKNKPISSEPVSSVSIESDELNRDFSEKPIFMPEPTEEEIVEILHSMGKFKDSDQLNCNTCGYKTCRDKAKAVYCNMSEITMCLPFVRKKAESIRNTIFEYTPNAILFLDPDMNIIEINPKAEEILGVHFEDVEGQNIEALVGRDILFDIRLDKSAVIHKKLCIDSKDICIIFEMSYIKEENVYMVIMSDITQEEKNIKALNAMKERTLDAAQEVIDKQMRVAQEIASLLGETTAETKIILTRLKKIAMD